MTMASCPGQNTRFWGPQDIFDIPCPDCGRAVEFFKDDSRRTCKGCGKEIYNPRNSFGCANWCPAARECLGPEKYESLRELAQKEVQRKNDMESLLAGIPLHEAELRLLFKCLYLKQGNPDRLFDTDELRRLQEDNPELFEKVTRYYQQFRKGRP
jgi:ribosomal protein S27E